MGNLDLDQGGGEGRAYRRFVVAFGVVLVVCFAGISLGMAAHSRSLIRESLLARSRSLFEQIVLAREWVSSYGGVYVLKGAGAESNPWLADPDIATADGRVLTRRNPAIMTREISDLAGRDGSFSLRITGPKPLNPANAPDGYEGAAIRSFESGAREAWSVEGERGSETFRYIGALVAEESCLKCHAGQGYRTGDVLGGISISFPVGAFLRAERRGTAVIVGIGLAASALLFLVLLGFLRGLRRKLDEARRELREAAVHDPLTGLYNRRYVLGRYEEEFAQAKRKRSALSAAIVDADDFKRVNDDFGHLTGDAVLKAIAATLRDGLRPYDIVGRYGGEEFLILLPATDRSEAYRACERVREEVEAGLRAKVEGLPRTVTVSIGIASLDPDADSPSSLLGRADAALYKAKAEGKNRTSS